MTYLLLTSINDIKNYLDDFIDSSEISNDKLEEVFKEFNSEFVTNEILFEFLEV